MDETATPPPRPALDGFFASLRGTGLRRNTDDRWLAGVCSGVADRFDVDPLLIRGILLVLLFVGGLGGLVYLVAWALLPQQQGRIVAEDALHGDGRGIALLVLIALVVVGNVLDRWWLWLVLVPVLAGLGWAVRSARQGRTPEEMGQDARRFADRVGAYVTGPPTPAPATAAADPASPTGPALVAPHGLGPGRTGPVAAPMRVVQRRRPRGGLLALLLTAGLAVAGYGLGGLYAGTTAYAGSRDLLSAAAAVAGAGLALVIVGLAGRRAGFTVFLVTVFTATTFIGVTVGPVPGGGFGSRTWTAARPPDGGFALTAGRAELALAGAPTGTVVRVALGAGHLGLTVPRDTTVTLASTVRAGQVVVVRPDGSREVQGGGGDDLELSVGNGPTAIRVDASVLAGEIVLTQER